MPIKVDAEILVFSEAEFHGLAEKVIGISFEVHNSFGRLMDEKVYKDVISSRCEAAGIVPARREIEILVSHHDFQKSYFMDALFANGLMVELKTVEKLSSAHHAQALHYLLLAGMKHGLLVNLRPGKIDKRFVSTSLDLTERRRFVVCDTNWDSSKPASQKLRQWLRTC